MPTAVDFVVSFPAGYEPVILQVTDPQIIDASREPPNDLYPLSPDSRLYWAADKKDDRCYTHLREAIEATHPDFILVTGDLVYGKFDHDGAVLQEFIDFMEGFGVPWAPVFGNHDNESNLGVDRQCAMLEAAEHCCFKQRALTGNGNYTVGIAQGECMTRVFFMLDSNGCDAASRTSIANGHTKITIGFGQDQVDWYTEQAGLVRLAYPDAKISFVFHIQPAAFGDAFRKYDTDGTTHVHIDRVPHAEGDFGYIGAPLKGLWDTDKTLFRGMQALGADSIFVGHEHASSASILHEGVRLQYGAKCSTYDRANYVTPDHTVISVNRDGGIPWLGCSVFSLSPDGEIQNPHIYQCKISDTADWDTVPPRQ